MTPKEYKFLMNNRKELTIEDLNELLADNEVNDTDFDPVAEAFKVIRLLCYCYAIVVTMLLCCAVLLVVVEYGIIV